MLLAAFGVCCEEKDVAYVATKVEVKSFGATGVIFERFAASNELKQNQNDCKNRTGQHIIIDSLSIHKGCVQRTSGGLDNIL